MFTIQCPILWYVKECALSARSSWQCVDIQSVSMDCRLTGKLCICERSLKYSWMCNRKLYWLILQKWYSWKRKKKAVCVSAFKDEFPLYRRSHEKAPVHTESFNCQSQSKIRRYQRPSCQINSHPVAILWVARVQNSGWQEDRYSVQSVSDL